LNPKGEFWNRLERALDLSKNVSEPAKNDLGNNPSTIENKMILAGFKRTESSFVHQHETFN
jgi:hypothetical protein